jgi:peroxiredoxin
LWNPWARGPSSLGEPPCRSLAVSSPPACPRADSGAPGLAHAKPAPAFTAVDIDGKTRSLAEFKGKVVVLEWVNEGCPYVKKHYSGNMQGLQQAATADGVVWLSVASSAPGKQGYFADGAAAKTWMNAKGAKPTTLLLDSQGTVATAYKAKTTPHMFVIDRGARWSTRAPSTTRPAPRSRT